MHNSDTTRQLLYDLENRLLQPEVRHSSAELEKLLADDFVEFGSGGRIYNRQSIIEELGREMNAKISMTDFKMVTLTPEVALVTYRATYSDQHTKATQHSLRSSIWKLVDDSWRIVFHQGTPIAAP